MRLDNQLKQFCVSNEISISELARRLNKSPQAMSQKIARGTFSLEDLEDIAIVTGCKLECNFILMNGDKIRIVE